MHPPPRRRAPGGRESGFTLVELLVVLGIIGLLTTLVVINVLPMQSRAQVQKARADIALLEQAVETWRLDTGRYPTTEEGLPVLTRPGAMGTLVRRLPEDPWGRPYLYQRPGREDRPYDIWTLGADGQPGGEGENADIGTWG